MKISQNIQVLTSIEFTHFKIFVYIVNKHNISHCFCLFVVEMFGFKEMLWLLLKGIMDTTEYQKWLEMARQHNMH